MASRYEARDKVKKEVYPFRNIEDIASMIKYFEEKEQWNHYLSFMVGLLIGRRVGDTLSLRWSDLYYRNGIIKEEIDTIVEQKTGKTTAIAICLLLKESIELYREKTGLSPEDYYGFVFPSRTKNLWREHKGAEIYKPSNHSEEEKIRLWVKFLDRDFKEKRIQKIYEQWQKCKNGETRCKYKYNNIEEFLYDEEYRIALKGQVKVYQDAFKDAAEASGITYNVNTHSTRQSFGYWSRMIHPYDVDSMEILREIFNHDSIATTAHYIGITREKKQGYFTDMGDFVGKILNGEKEIIKNTPVISIKTSDLRDILTLAVTDKSGAAPLNMMNKLMGMVEECRVI